jgi:hypothetical protein
MNVPPLVVISLLATPRPLPFTYTYDTLSQGTSEVEQYTDLVPAKVKAGKNVLSTQMQFEFETGITDRVELGLYATFVPMKDAPELPVGNGAKQRLRVRLAEEGKWPIDIALYGEVVEQENEFELEGKLILQRRFGKLRVVGNAWFEREWEFGGHFAWVANPTLGATYELHPSVHLGFESWLRAVLPDVEHEKEFAHGPHLYAGPTFMVNFGRFWFSSGFYLRTTDFGRALNPGEGFGALWFRSLIGVFL